MATDPLTPNSRKSDALRLFLAGDVMTGRGVDQILPHPSDPVLFEPFVRDARDYVELAERRNGEISRPVAFDYIWGDAPEILERAGVDCRIVNLETAITDYDEPWPRKGINYRMHPANAPVLEALGLNVCVLANNHVLDWMQPGLIETLETLESAGISPTGAGRDRAAAEAPATISCGEQRVLVFGFGTPSSGIPPAWTAEKNKPGVNFLPDLSGESLDAAIATIRAHARPTDRIVTSIHWGGNWGYEVPEPERTFARVLIDKAGVDIVHGHSSHHPRGIEIHSGRLILYGCGDFINDYEGITGHEQFRPDLTLMYLPELDAASGALRGLELVPFRVRRMRLERAGEDDARWLAKTLTRHSEPFGSGIRIRHRRNRIGDGWTLAVQWPNPDRP